MHDLIYEMRFQRPGFPLFKVIRVAKKFNKWINI